MTSVRALILAVAAAALLSGCSTFNSLTGQTDNTVLPGKREDAIPGRSQFPEKNDVAVAQPGKSGTDQVSTGSTETYCAPDDAACAPPGSSGDTFKDPQ